MRFRPPLFLINYIASAYKTGCCAPPSVRNFSALFTLYTVHKCLPPRLMIDTENPQKSKFGKKNRELIKKTLVKDRQTERVN